MSHTATAPATPCPPWCTVTDHEPGDRYHVSDYTWTGNVGIGLDIAQDDQAPTITVSLGSEPEHLTPDQADALIGRLTHCRDLLATTEAGCPR